MASGVLTFILTLLGLIPAVVVALDPVFGGAIKALIVTPVATYISSVPLVGSAISGFLLAVETSQWVLVAVCGVIWLIIAGITAALEGVKGVIIACLVVGVAVFLLVGTPLGAILIPR